MPYIAIGTCFRFYNQMRVQKGKKHLHIEFIVTSHNSVTQIIDKIFHKQFVMYTYLCIFKRFP